MSATIITSLVVLPSEISIRPVMIVEFDHLILFDQKALLVDTEIPASYGPPPLSHQELTQAVNRGDILNWLVKSDNNFVGYYWLEHRTDYLFIAGVAIAFEYYGQGFAQCILNLAAQHALQVGLKTIKLAVMPLNGRAINAYFKHGYQITECHPQHFGPQYPDKFRFIMQKKLVTPLAKNIIDTCQILCTNNDELQSATDRGYVGVSLIRDLNNKFGHRIIFVKYE